MKIMMTVLAMVAVIGGWAVFATREAKPADVTAPAVVTTGEVSRQQSGMGSGGDNPPQQAMELVLEPVPTVVPPPDWNGEPVAQPAVVEQPVTQEQPVVKASQPAAAPQPTLRDVSAPPTPTPAPITTTSSSR